MKLSFGFLQDDLQLNWASGSITPLPDHAAIVRCLLSPGDTCGGWLYPQLVEAPGNPSEAGSRPAIPERWFSLPPTHLLTLSSEEPDLAPFMVTFLGFLIGLRLLPEGWNHVTRVPIQRGKLNDFSAGRDSLQRALEHGTRFWEGHSVEVRWATFGILHWHLFGQLYQEQFEIFRAQYIVLDACFHLHKLLDGDMNIPHGLRAGVMGKKYGLHIPVWAQPDPVDKKKSPIGNLRNELFHEGLYGGEPIGFAHPKSHPMLNLELTAFNARLILSLMGIKNEYVKSKCDTRSKHSFDL